jgi:23S rRNA (adenine2503-C2)-methyltransferase
MDILRHIQVPTGDILVTKGEKGQLESLSLGDYGKDHNLKCDFMGLSRDLSHVGHTKMLPLEEKWVVTISTQYGCSMDCGFCDVPKVGPGRNATLNDLVEQVHASMSVHPEVVCSRRLNLHYARMGEPTWNPNVITSARILREKLDPWYNLHPVVSTMMPRKNVWLESFIRAWMQLKNETFKGNAGLQISVNSTSNNERDMMFSGNTLPLDEIALIFRDIVPVGRKITLNFAVADYTIDPKVLLNYFNPDHFLIKLTPMHRTNQALANNIETIGDAESTYPYQEHEAALVAAGYDVIVFIASHEEDMGRITCGNAILSGTMPEVTHKVIK